MSGRQGGSIGLKVWGLQPQKKNTHTHTHKSPMALCPELSMGQPFELVARWLQEVNGIQLQMSELLH